VQRQLARTLAQQEARVVAYIPVAQVAQVEYTPVAPAWTVGYTRVPARPAGACRSASAWERLAGARTAAQAQYGTWRHRIWGRRQLQPSPRNYNSSSTVSQESMSGHNRNRMCHPPHTVCCSWDNAVAAAPVAALVLVRGEQPELPARPAVVAHIVALKASACMMVALSVAEFAA